MKILDINKIGTANIFKWDREYLFKVLTTGRNPVLKNPKLIAAFQYLDRQTFLPQKLKDKAYEDLDLDIGYDEIFTRPSVLAQMSELIDPKIGGNYLDIGTGTGFFAMILGFVAGEEGRVITIERVQWLWELARNVSTNYKDIRNISYLYRDGKNGLAEQGPYDGIHISFNMENVEIIKQQLKDGGKLVYPTNNNDIRVVERNGDEFIEEIVPGFVFKEGKDGVV